MKVTLLLRLYPRAWRERYGEEFVELLARNDIGGRAVLDVARSALRERIAVHGRIPAMMALTIGLLPGVFLISAALSSLTTLIAFQLQSTFGANPTPAAVVRIVWVVVALIVMLRAFKRAPATSTFLRVGAAVFVSAVFMKWLSETWMHPMSWRDIDSWTAFGRGDALLFGGLSIEVWIRAADPRLAAILATFSDEKPA